MAEKRTEKRKINRTPVKFGDQGSVRTAFTSNFSTRGFFVRTNRPFTVGTILHFEFQLADGTVIRIQGRVAHSKRIPPEYARLKRGGMGIEVLENQEEYLRLLKALKVPTE